jgi:hypothetical protein
MFPADNIENTDYRIKERFGKLFFIMGFLWAAFDVNPLISGLAVGLLFGLTDYTKESR